VAQIGQLSYQSGSGADTLWIRANDGTVWGPWSKGFTVTAPPDAGPTVSVANLTANPGQNFPGTSLFTSYSDPFNSPATQYDFWNGGAGGGHFVLAGTARGAGHTIITATQLSQLTYQSGSGADTLDIRANDGTAWGSWSNEFTVTAPTDFGPTLTTVGNLTAIPGQSFATSLLAGSNSPFAPITQYDFYDSGAGGGHFAVSGTALPTNQDNIVSASQLAQTTYVAGSGADTLWVKATDGISWGPWSHGFTVTG